MMRICHICNSFPPLIGGTATHNYSVVKYLYERGYRVDVILIQSSKNLLLRDNYSDEVINTVHSPSYTLPSLPRLVIHTIPAGPFRTYYNLIRKVHELERDGKIDILDIHHYPAAIPFSKKRKILLSLHFYELSCPRWPPLPCEKASFRK